MIIIGKLLVTIMVIYFISIVVQSFAKVVEESKPWNEEDWR